MNHESKFEHALKRVIQKIKSQQLLDRSKTGEEMSHLGERQQTGNEQTNMSSSRAYVMIKDQW